MQPHRHGDATPGSFEDGLKLVQLRGQSMQAASDAAPSGMVSVIGLDAEKVSLLTPETMTATLQHNTCSGSHRASDAAPSGMVPVIDLDAARCLSNSSTLQT